MVAVIHQWSGKLGLPERRWRASTTVSFVNWSDTTWLAGLVGFLGVMTTLIVTSRQQRKTLETTVAAAYKEDQAARRAEVWARFTWCLGEVSSVDPVRRVPGLVIIGEVAHDSFALPEDAQMMYSALVELGSQLGFPIV